MESSTARPDAPPPYHQEGEFTLGPWRVHPRLNRISGPGASRELEPKVMGVLVCLSRRAGSVVGKEELQRAVWAGTAVSDAVLPRAISLLRKALGDDRREPRYIRTVSKVGYQLIAPVARPGAEEEASAAPRPWVPWALAAALVGTGLLALWISRSAPVAPLAPARQVTADPGEEIHPALSPGGARLVYIRRGRGGSWDLHLARTDRHGSFPLGETPDRDELRPAWSPDGERLAFLGHEDGRMTLLVAGVDPNGRPRPGSAREVASLEGPPRGIDPDTAPALSWSGDGSALVLSLPSATGLAAHEIALADGARRRLTDPPPGRNDLAPAFSPDGRLLAFTRHTNLVNSELMVLSMEEGTVRALTGDGQAVRGHAWLPDGRIIFASNRTGRFLLWTVSAEGGPPELLPAGGWSLLGPAVARKTGEVAFESRSADADLTRVRLESGESPGRGMPAEMSGAGLSSTRWDGFPAHSPDGRSVAFVSERSGSLEVWVAGAASTEADPSPGQPAPRRLTRFGGPVVGPPSWSRDGRLAVSVRLEGLARIHLIDTATGAARQVTGGPHNHVAPRFSRDGGALYCASDRDGTWQIWRISLEDGSARRLTRGGGHVAQESPDGSAVYFARRGSPGLWSVAPGGGEERLLVKELAAADLFNWTVSGGQVLFPVRRGDGAELWSFDPATGERGPVGATFPAPAGHLASLSISPDRSEALLMRTGPRESDLYVMNALP